jgi:hypothetical protein
MYQGLKFSINLEVEIEQNIHEEEEEDNERNVENSLHVPISDELFMEFMNNLILEMER